MKLVFSNNKTKEVKIGDAVQNNDGEQVVVEHIVKPHKPSSTGRVYVRGPREEHGHEFFPGVFGMEWIEREDHEPVRVMRRRKVKERSHNEWFRTVSLNGRKSCPECKVKLEPGESIWSWGEYHNAKWRTVMRFCHACFINRVQIPLQEHVGTCGCKVELVIASRCPVG